MLNIYYAVGHRVANWVIVRANKNKNKIGLQYFGSVHNGN